MKEPIELVIHQGSYGEILAIEAKKTTMDNYDIKIRVTDRDIDPDLEIDPYNLLAHKEGAYTVKMRVLDRPVTVVPDSEIDEVFDFAP